METSDKSTASLETIEKQINIFLEKETPEVLAIRGAWGAGKTYTWNKFFTKANKDITPQKYSYVSLFGLDSLEAFKFALYLNCVSTEDVGKKFSTKKRIKNLGLQLVSISEKLPVIKGISPLLKLAENITKDLLFLSIKDTIICLDDLERTKLGIQELLGLIIELKEQKGCKIVLIFNDEEFSKEAKTAYKKYREKVIDKELHFEPTPNECAKIVFDDDEKDKQYTDILKEYCGKLGITNIRIIQKIDSLQGELAPLLKNYEEETYQDVLASLVLFAYIFYAEDKNLPDFKAIKNLWHDDYRISLEKEPKTDADEEEKQRWDNLHRIYGYSHTDELDLLIANFVENGYFDEASMKREIGNYNANACARQQQKDYMKAYEIYHNSFDHNEIQMVSQIYEAAKKNMKSISASELDMAVNMLRELAQEEKADALIEHAIKEIPNLEYFDNQQYFHSLKDKKMSQRFEEHYVQNSPPPPTPLEVFNRELLSHDTWQPKEVKILLSQSPADWLALFEATKSDKLVRRIRQVLALKNVTNGSEEYGLIVNNITEALEQVAKTSELNKIRVESLYLGNR